MARPTQFEAKRKQEQLAHLIAADISLGIQARAVDHARTVRMTPERALRLSWDTSFLAQVQQHRKAA